LEEPPLDELRELDTAAQESATQIVAADPGIPNPSVVSAETALVIPLPSPSAAASDYLQLEKVSELPAEPAPATAEIQNVAAEAPPEPVTPEAEATPMPARIDLLPTVPQIPILQPDSGIISEVTTLPGISAVRCPACNTAYPAAEVCPVCAQSAKGMAAIAPPIIELPVMTAQARPADAAQAAEDSIALDFFEELTRKLRA
jgi:hypothetical protein